MSLLKHGTLFVLLIAMMMCTSSDASWWPQFPERTGNEFEDTYNAAELAKDWIPVLLASPKKIFEEYVIQGLEIPDLLDLIWPDIAGQSYEEELAQIEFYKKQAEERKNWLDNQPSFPDGYAHP